MPLGQEKLPLRRGKFIVIEGPDNSGKTTQAKLLQQSYPDADSVIFTTEPTKKELDKRFTIGPFIRQRLEKSEMPPRMEGLREMCLFYADRIEHTEWQIRPAIEAGKCVVTDRYDASTIAYEGALGVNHDFVARFREELILEGYILQPDLTIVLNITLKEFVKRNSGKPTDKFHDKEFQKKVIGNYKNLNAFFPHDAVVYVDGMRPQGRIQSDILSIVEKYLGAPRLDKRLYDFK